MATNLSNLKAELLELLDEEEKVRFLSEIEF